MRVSRDSAIQRSIGSALKSGWRISLVNRNRRPSTASLFLCAVTAATVLALAPLSGLGQNPAPSAQPALEFEVASVKLSLAPRSGKNDRFLMPFGNVQPTSGLFSDSAPVAMYLLFAYDIQDPSQIQTLLKSLPDWAKSDNYDIEARADGIPTREQMRMMMQSLLKDRFKLALHYETHDGPVNALVLDKPGVLGPKLVVHPENAPCQIAPQPTGATPASAGHPVYCGLDVWRADGELHFRLIEATMADAARLLNTIGGMIGARDARPIEDKTGLAGKYDLEIVFVPEANGPVSSDAQGDSGGPTFTGALKDQLGLKLVKDTGPVQVLVIDHIEKLSPD